MNTRAHGAPTVVGPRTRRASSQPVQQPARASRSVGPFGSEPSTHGASRNLFFCVQPKRSIKNPRLSAWG
uniref:Uncharacterized protein n=1 Tax=Anopheles atroparvus TaxID=41427 RepID=A0AAG5DWH2_ANOAO